MRKIEDNASKPGFRVCEHSVQMNHVHLIVEADGPKALAGGMGGLQISLTRAINRHLGRKGSIFPECYHHRVLETPNEVRNVLTYVLYNCHKHNDPVHGPDPVSSGFSFEGWDRAFAGATPRRLPRARTWLPSVGWRKWHGPVPLLAPRSYAAIGTTGRAFA